MKNAGILPQRKPYKIKKISNLLKNQNIKTFPVTLEEITKSKIDFCISAGMPNVESEQLHIEAFELAKKNKIPILIIESPAIRSLPEIKSWTRLCWNSIFMDEGIHPYEDKNRWNKLAEFNNLHLKEWHQGDKVLFNLQISTDSALNRLNFSTSGYFDFVVATINNLKNHTDRKIVIRPHPLNKSIVQELLKKCKNLEISTRSLEEDLNDSKVMITYNSTSSVESIINGTPVISLDPSCIAYEVSGHSLTDIETCLYFDRSLWLNKISYMQWHTSELLNNETWNTVTSKINEI